MSGTGRRSAVSPIVAGVLAGAVIALVVGLMAMINLQYGAPWAQTHSLVAQVSDADSMALGSDVRIAGRLVGQVVAVQAAGDQANITLNVDAADWPLPADTTLSVRLATLLGQKYVQLNPGTSAQHLADGATIGLARTRPVVDFDQMLDAFDQPTRSALTSLIRTVSAGVAGREGTLQQLISNLSDLSVTSQAPTGELATRDPELNAILVNLGTTASQLNASRDDLAGVISNLNNVTATLASDSGRALTGFIANTDSLDQVSNQVLGGGEAAALGSGLQKLGSLATYMNTLMGSLIPQTISFSQPVAAAEPGDKVNGNQGIPARAALDLIYEVGNASSQDYGSTNFGTPSSPNFQGNFFLRQDLQGNENCASPAPPNVHKSCLWGDQYPPGKYAATVPSLPPPPVIASLPAPANPMCAVLGCSDGNGICPLTDPLCATPSPSPSPVPPPPTPSPSPSPSPSASPSPSPSPSPSASTAPAGSPSSAAVLTFFTLTQPAWGGGVEIDVWTLPLYLRLR